MYRYVQYVQHSYIDHLQPTLVAMYLNILELHCNFLGQISLMMGK